MARTRNAVAAELVKISTTPGMEGPPAVLAGTGRFGDALSEVADELLTEKLREIELFRAGLTRRRALFCEDSGCDVWR